MDIKELKAKSPAELATHIEELRREQFGLRMARGTGQLTKTHEMRRVRRDIARAKTVLAAKG